MTTRPISRSAPKTAELLVPQAWRPGGPPQPPPKATWDRLHGTLFKQRSNGNKDRKATVDDVDRMLTLAEKNGVTPGELTSINSIRSTQHPYFEGASKGAAYKKLATWLHKQAQVPVQVRLEGELSQQASKNKGKGKVDLACAQKLMAWVEGVRNSVFGRSGGLSHSARDVAAWQ